MSNILLLIVSGNDYAELHTALPFSKLHVSVLYGAARRYPHVPLRCKAYTVRAHPLNPRSASLPFSACRSQSRTGTAKPVLHRRTTSSGNGLFGERAMSNLVRGSGELNEGATARSKSTSTKGTLISRECAIPAQSASRKSWLRMYQAISSADTLSRSELTPRTVSSSRKSGCISLQTSRATSSLEYLELPRHK
jgi:hypothetical protein